VLHCCCQLLHLLLPGAAAAAVRTAVCRKLLKQLLQRYNGAADCVCLLVNGPGIHWLLLLLLQLGLIACCSCCCCLMAAEGGW
jgi:hypothetical protein